MSVDHQRTAFAFGLPSGIYEFYLYSRNSVLLMVTPVYLLYKLPQLNSGLSIIVSTLYQTTFFHHMEILKISQKHIILIHIEKQRVSPIAFSMVDITTTTCTRLSY